MKLKSRNQLLKEYNDKYDSRISNDIEENIREYFKQNKLNLDKACIKARKKLDKIILNREYETIHIIMYEYPMKTDRPRSFRNHIYSPNAAANHSYFEKAVKSIYKSVKNVLKLINTPAEILVDAYLEMPAAVPPDEVILFESKILNPIDMPDYDNIGKCYTDILKNVLIIDDDIFYTGTINKYYSVLPRVEITLTYLRQHESDFIFKKIKNRKSVKEAIASGQLLLQKLV